MGKKNDDISAFDSIVEGLESEFPEDLTIPPLGRNKLGFSRNTTSLALGFLLFFFGIGVLLLGLILFTGFWTIIVGLLGFALMVFGGVKLTSPKGMTVKQANRLERRQQRMRKMEENWDNRWGQL